RRPDRGRDAAAAAGPAPERTPQARVRARHARRVPLRRRLARHAGLRRATRDHVMANLLEAIGMRKEFGGLVAVSDITFVIPQGSIVSLIGPNGAGKTTFFNMITGVYKPTEGQVLFGGEDLTGKPPHAVTERGIGRTFQNIRLFQDMTALENVLVGMHCRLKSGIIGGILRTPKVRREESTAAERAQELLEYCSLVGQSDNYARNLPYGDQRRLEVARALATEPQLLLLDEPTAGMNPRRPRSSPPLSRSCERSGA